VCGPTVAWLNGAAHFGTGSEALTARRRVVSEFQFLQRPLLTSGSAPDRGEGLNVRKGNVGGLTGKGECPVADRS